MRVRVNQGKSVLFDGNWYDQRAEFDCEDLKVYEDDVSPVEAPKKSIKPEAKSQET
jgi:hypothetical protein